MSVDLLADLAASIAVPVDAFGPTRVAVEVIREGPDHEPNAPCAHRYCYRLYFALDGGRRRSEPVGPVFERLREAARLAALIKDGSAAGGGCGSAEPASSRSCVVCMQPLPAGSRPHRRTCSGTCRQRLGRQAGAAEQRSRASKARAPGSVSPAAVSAGPAQLDLNLLTQQEAAPAISRPGAAISEVRHALAIPTPAV